MPVPAKLRPVAKPVAEPRAILGPGGNRVETVSRDPKCKSEPQKPRRSSPELPASTLRSGVSVDSTCSTDSSSSASSAKVKAKCRETVKRSCAGKEPPKPAIRKAEDGDFPRDGSAVRRCDWITPFSDPLHASFHDEEWGVPVHDDRHLFELLVFSQALAELSWPLILQMRDVFRKLFDNFDPSSIAQSDEKNLPCVKINGKPLLSDVKLRAVIANAKQTVKIQKEFGSFSNYIWSFVHHKPMRNGFRYARQVPVKTPKAEIISKNLMQRGFCCVGPTVIYSFMQAAGIANDHLQSCFRYQECNADTQRDLKPKTEEQEAQNEELGIPSPS